MKRREFITLLGGAAAWPFAARGQQGGKIARVGVLASRSAQFRFSRAGLPILLAELHKLGFTEGRNLIIEFRRTDDGVAKAFAGANDLVAAKADVLITGGTELALQAADAASPPVPIVMLANNFDPFARGYVKSLSHPGGNITGLVYRSPELAAKQLELLAEAFPGRTRVGDTLGSVLGRPVEVGRARRAISRLSLRPLKLENPPYDFEAAFRTMSADEAEMLLVLSTPCSRRTAYASLNLRSSIACPRCSLTSITLRPAD